MPASFNPHVVLGNQYSVWAIDPFQFRKDVTWNQAGRTTIFLAYTLQIDVVQKIYGLYAGTILLVYLCAT